jgi:hypothetical protein
MMVRRGTPQEKVISGLLAIVVILQTILSCTETVLQMHVLLVINFIARLLGINLHQKGMVSFPTQDVDHQLCLLTWEKNHLYIVDLSPAFLLQCLKCL